MRTGSWDLMLLTLWWTPEDIGLGMNQLQPIRCHRRRILINWIELPNYRLFLKGMANKAAFITGTLAAKEPVWLTDDQSIVLTGGFTNREIHKKKTVVTLLTQLFYTQEESDTRMVLHAICLSWTHNYTFKNCYQSWGHRICWSFRCTSATKALLHTCNGRKPNHQCSSRKWKGTGTPSAQDAQELRHRRRRGRYGLGRGYPPRCVPSPENFLIFCLAMVHFGAFWALVLMLV